MKENVGGSIAPGGADVIFAVSITLPVNPPEGVMEIFEEFPSLAPAPNVTAVPLKLKLAGMYTMTDVVEDALVKSAELAGSGV